jgi:hypothetical protein
MEPPLEEVQATEPPQVPPVILRPPSSRQKRLPTYFRDYQLLKFLQGLP